MERHHKKFIHSMYGDEMLLMFDGVERVITSIDAEKKTFSFVSKAAVLSELQCSADDFLDACLLSGFEYCPTFPPLLEGGTLLRVPESQNNSPTLHGKVNPLTVVQLVKQHRGGHAAISSLGAGQGPRNSQYLNAFYRARALIKFSLVVAEDGKVLPLPLATVAAQDKSRRGEDPSGGGANNSTNTSGNGAAGVSPSVNPPVIRLGNGVLSGQKSLGTGATAGANTASATDVPEIPSDLHDVFFYRLPDEIYTHLGSGLIGTSVYHSLLSGQCIESEPLEGGALAEYKKFIRHTLLESPLSPRCVSLALAANQLGEFWKSRQVTAVYWFEPNRPHELKWTSNETQAFLTRVSRWNVRGNLISKALNAQNLTRLDLLLCLGTTRTPEGAQSTITPRAPSQPALERKDEITANARWRLLELRGFINHEHLHTALGRALYHAIKHTLPNDALQEPLYVALELVRAHALHANYFDRGATSYSGGPSLDSIEGFEDKAVVDNHHLLLVMRALSLVPMALRPQAWNAPVSRELLAFNAFARAMTRALRSLAETIASHMLLSGTAKVRETETLRRVAGSLPFQAESNTGLGMIVKCYVEGLMAYLGTYAQLADPEELEDASMTLITMIENNFQEIREVRHELARGFRFWSALVVAVRLLGQEGELGADYVAQFEAADKWFQPMTFK